MAPGEVRPVAALTPKGKLLFWGRLVGLADALRLLLPAAVGDLASAHLRKYAAFQRVAIGDLSDDWLRIGLYGAPQSAGGSDGVLRLPPDGEFSGELLAPRPAGAAVVAALRDGGSIRVGDAIAETLRIEAGRPKYGRDADGSNLPDEIGLEAAISATKGCYVGQEIVARRKTYGRINWRLVGYRFSAGGIAPGSSLCRPDESLVETRRNIPRGRVTSTADSPRFGSIGLGFAFHDVAIGDRLVLEEAPRLAGIVSGLPFE